MSSLISVFSDNQFKPMASESYVNNKVKEAIDSSALPSYYGYADKPFNFAGKTVYFFGDSICAGHNGTGMAPKNYVDLFSERVGCIKSNKGVGGSCFSYTWNGTISIVDKIKETDLTNADIIIIEGGINDWQTNATSTQLETALNDLSTYLSANYTGDIVIITPISSSREASQSHTMTVPQIRKIMEKWAVKNRYSLVLGENFNFPAEENLLSQILYGDGLHPSNEGYELYAKCLCNALAGSEGGSGGSSTDVQINGTSITSQGEADIKTQGTYNASSNKIATMSDLPDISTKQDQLVSGTNIKTINNTSILGSGNIEIEGGTSTETSVDDITFANGIVRDGDTVKLFETNDVAYAISDSNGNSVLIVGNEGDIEFKLSDYLKREIRSISPYEFDAQVFMVPCVGQSLALNTDAGSSTFSSLDPLSYNKNLENVNLQDMNTGFCEAFTLAAAKYGVTLPTNFKIITCVVGSGGTSINYFGKGSTHYNSVLSNITTAKDACDTAGLSMIVPGFMWTQGEEDMRCGGSPASYGTGNWDPFLYHEKLEAMIENYNTDIKAITGQTMDVHCFSYQTGSHNAYFRYPRIAMEQSLLATLDKRMLLSKTMYDVNYNNDQVHCPAGTYRNMGNMYGLACFKYCVLKRNYHWVHPIGFELDDNILYIDFDVEKGLMFDTTLVDNLTDGNYGFNIVKVPNELATSDTTPGISQSTTTITNVEIKGTTRVKITMSKAPEATDILTYGVNGAGWENITGYNISEVAYKSGHTNGARGCLRDTDVLINNNSGATLTHLTNWCPIFEYKFGGAE